MDRRKARQGAGGWGFIPVAIIPYLGVLISLISVIFAVYLLYLGLPRVMKAPQDKAAGYTALVVIVAIVVGIVIAFVIGSANSPFRLMVSSMHVYSVVYVV